MDLVRRYKYHITGGGIVGFAFNDVRDFPIYEIHNLVLPVHLGTVVIGFTVFGASGVMIEEIITDYVVIFQYPIHKNSLSQNFKYVKQNIKNQANERPPHK